MYLMRVKILAIEAGLSSISLEGDQLILRFPEGQVPPEKADLPSQVRVGKSAYWVKFNPQNQDWPNLLEEILENLIATLEN